MGQKNIDNIIREKNNIVWHEGLVTRRMREKRNGHKSVILWFTGLSGSGKSTLAHAVERKLHQKYGCATYVLDGDNVRHGLCSDLGFSNFDRKENIRRIAEVAKLFLNAGIITLTAFISPFRSDREYARSMFLEGEFMEIYCNASLEICERRDVKGLYRRARIGEIKNFTGISSPYEEPFNPEVNLDTGNIGLDECVDRVVNILRVRGVIGHRGLYEEVGAD